MSFGGGFFGHVIDKLNHVTRGHCCSPVEYETICDKTYKAFCVTS